MPTKLSITIEIDAPLLTKSSAPGNPGIDAVMAKNFRNEAVLYDRHIKGRLREAWQELASDLNIPVDKWLGVGSGSRHDPGGSFMPNIGMIQFKDFTGPVISEDNPRVRIEIDPDRRTAKENMLQVIESPFASGQRLIFNGLLEMEDGIDLELALRAIKAGLYWSGTFGGMRTSGFGRVHSVVVNVENAAAPDTLIDTDNDRIWIWLTTSP